MKRLFFILSVALLCGALSCPSVEAQSRGRNNGNNGGGQSTPAHNSGGQSRSQQSVRPATGSSQNRSQQVARPATTPKANVDANRVNSSGTRPASSKPAQGTAPATRPGNNGQTTAPATRPGNNGYGNGNGAAPGNTNRPGNGVNTPSTRPGNGNGNQSGTKPGGNNQPGNKPGGNNQPGNHPGSNPPGNNFGPGHNPGGPGHNPGGPGHGGPGHNPGGPGGPGHGHGHGPAWSHVPNQPPYRPMMPPSRPYWRPTPPPAFRPGPRYPIISTILGVSLGTAINFSLDYLFNQGYMITGYTNDAVYLNDVPQLNLIWPNATLYYDRGRLVGSQFVYSTSYYDMSRYYNTYNRLLNAYGAPIVTTPLAGGGMECSWFGFDGQYVTLQFVSAIANNGSSRFYTTLSFGR